MPYRRAKDRIQNRVLWFWKRPLCQIFRITIQKTFIGNCKNAKTEIIYVFAHVMIDTFWS